MAFKVQAAPPQTAAQGATGKRIRKRGRGLGGLTAWMRQAQPPTLVVWERYDPSFETAEAQAYTRELPQAEVHVIDADHFALDERADEIAAYVRGFLSRQVLRQLASRRSERMGLALCT